MKQYAFIDWDLVQSSPLMHTYRRGWRDHVRDRRLTPASARSIRRQVSIEWNGLDRLTVRTGRFLPLKSSWKSADVQGIVFGIREHESIVDRTVAPRRSWLWFIHLTGKAHHAKGHRDVLAEFLVAHQHDAPSTSRAMVPHRVKELLTWFEHCTGHRVHGPVLVTDEASRRNILSNVD